MLSSLRYRDPIIVVMSIPMPYFYTKIIDVCNSSSLDKRPTSRLEIDSSAVHITRITNRFAVSVFDRILPILSFLAHSPLDSLDSLESNTFRFRFAAGIHYVG
jgi:hypothetical protein